MHTTYQAMEHVKPERTRSDLAAVPEPAVRRFAAYPGALAWLDREQDNLLAVARQAAEQRNEAAAQLPPTEALHYLLMRREFGRIVETQTVSLESARRTGDTAQQAVALNSLAHAHMELKEIDAALPTAHAALEIQNRRGDVHGQAAATESIGITYYFDNRAAEALPWLELALPLRRAGRELFGLVATLNNLGLMSQEARTR